MAALNAAGLDQAPWRLSQASSAAFSAVAVFFSWFLALFAETRDEHRWCYAKGPRQYLRGWLHLFGTHDDGIEALWFKGLYDGRAPAGWPEKARAGSWRARYHLRVNLG